jgi:hypothetical protein
MNSIKIFPLPWWEGIKGRGKIMEELRFHPHPNPPPSRGRIFLLFMKPIV